MPEQRVETDDRLAGAALAGAALLSLVAMAHHPTGLGHNALAQIVHGAMIVFVLILLAGYVRLAGRLDLRRFTTTLALVVYAMGAVANVLAATINGFVVAQVVVHDAPAEILRFCWALNQALANGAVYGTSLAFLIWGAALATKLGFPRIVGLVGIIAGLAPAVLLASGALMMNVAGAFLIYGLQAAFGVMAGAYLVRASRGSSND